ncbi:hypothetical protein MW887_010065 [Aspergillus wentii]|nr:hypothetical protein MW887_010065 [Aspergillus wentii]
MRREVWWEKRAPSNFASGQTSEPPVISNQANFVWLSLGSLEPYSPGYFPVPSDPLKKSPGEDAEGVLHATVADAFGNAIERVRTVLFPDDTGSKPFVCKECRRPFARQDALTRHEKLHVRATDTKHAQTHPSSHLAPQSTSIDALPSWDTSHASTAPPVTTSAPSQTWDARQPTQQSSLHHGATDLDFALIWPDSENLFQSIMSSDTMDQWQMPLGALPFSPVVQDVNGMNFGSPNSFDDRGSSIGAIPLGGGHQAVRDVTEMVTSSSSSVTAAVKATSVTSVFLDECLHMFFVRFIPTFPILHRATFVFRECTHPLLLNAIAIGSLYLGPKQSVAKGEALWRLAHTAVATSWQSLITHNGPYDACKGVQLLITAVLGQIYGALSKNRIIRTTSQVFRPLGFFWARHCGMLDSEPYSLENLPFPSAPDAEKEHQWRVWVAREIQQRALLAYHILDGSVAQMSGDGASARHVANPLSLPSSEAAFDASTPDEWLIHMRSQKTDQPSFRLVFRSLFPPAGSLRPLDYQFSAFALRVVLEGLQSLVSDSDESDLAAVGVPGKSDYSVDMCARDMISLNMSLEGLGPSGLGLI